MVAQKVRSLEGAIGLNVATGAYEDLLKAGVTDATEVTSAARTPRRLWPTSLLSSLRSPER